MKNEGEMHWTEDEEKLARYVLNRLDADERVELEHHLHVCGKCREMVDDELMLAAGAKALGREQLKSRLRQRLGQSDAKRIPWPHVLSAAAVLLIALGVATYHRWLPTTGSDDTVTGTDSPVALHKMDSAAGSSEGGKEAADVERDAGESTLQPSLAEKDGRKMEEAQRLKSETSPAGATSPSRRDNDVADAIQLENEEAAPLWVVGLVQSRQEPARGELQMNRDGEAKTFMSESVRAKSASGKAHQEGFAQSKSGEPVRTQRVGEGKAYQLVQLPLEALPVKRQHLVASGTIQTRVEVMQGGSQIILYTDSLFSEEDIREALIREVGDDSLEVIVGSTTVGYKLVPGWNQQLRTEPVR